MPILVQCPNPGCKASSMVEDSISGRNVKCKRCGTPFTAKPTFDAQKGDTKKGKPASHANPFPTLPAEFGRYRILRQLGRGGMGAVYLAQDTQLGRQVALKVPFFDAASSPQRAERFVREARSAAVLQHPNICTVYDAGQIDGRPFITMAYIAGTPLEKEIDPDAPMPQVRAAEIVRKIALALQHAHQTGIVHRDLKPANVMMAAGGEPVVMDFGLAKKVADVDPAEAKLTREGGLLGTPSYMAPEQVKGDAAAVGPVTDVYALGVILFEMLTGRTPFAGGITVVIGQILAAPAPHVKEFRPDVDARLDAICRKAMAKEPAERFASMAELAQALGQYLAAPSAPPPVATVVKAPPAAVTATFEDLRPLTRPLPALTKAKQRQSTAVPDAKAGMRRILLALAAGLIALVPLVVWLVAVSLRVETANGTLVVEINDAETEARVKNGKLILTGPDDKVRYILAPSEHNKTIEAGAYKVHVEGVDGLSLNTSEFTLKKGDKVTVRVTAALNAAATANDSDREAAEYVLSLGGTVRVNDQEDDLKAVADLPRETFRLTGVVLNGTQATDAGMAHFKHCKGLTVLSLEHTDVADAGLAHFKDCKRLTALNLCATKVTDRGLAYFQGCKDLSYLNLDYTGVGDAGLASFKECKSLTGLGLNGTGVTDAGMAYFQSCPDLNVLNFYGTQVGDVGLAYFKNCQKLRFVSAGVTKVTAGGVAELKKALPSCHIERDAGAESSVGVSPDREAAEYVLSLGGAVRVNDHNDDLKEVADLPRETFRLTGIDLWATKATDATAAHFKDCKNLTHLVLSGTKVTDAGLVHFKGCRDLDWLDLDEVSVGDQGLANFKDCKKLGTVGLKNAPITDVGLSYLKGCAGLTSIDLYGTRVGTGGLAALADSGRLKSLNLGQTQVSDLSPLKGMKLTLLYCDKTKVSDLSPLKEMPLEELKCDFKPERDAEILRFIKTLTTINDKPAAEFWKEVEGNQGKIAHGSEKPAPPSVPETADDKGWVSLFNGKDLKGWKVHPSQPGNWRVVKGVLTASTAYSFTHLYTDRDYADFHLHLEVKLNPGGNTGVNFRAPFGPVVPYEMAKPVSPSNQAAWGGGYRAGIDVNSIGGLFIDTDPVRRRDNVPQYKPDEWTTYEVVAEKNHIVIKVNGETACDYTDEEHRHSKGHIALAVWGSTIVEFRKIEIKKLTPPKALPPADKSTTAPPADPFKTNSVWVNKEQNQTLTVLERKGETFRARFVIGETIDREVTGAVKDGKLSWLAKDVKAIKGTAGADNQATIARDGDGDLLDFTWGFKGGAAGAFILRLKTSK